MPVLKPTFDLTVLDDEPEREEEEEEEKHSDEESAENVPEDMSVDDGMLHVDNAASSRATKLILEHYAQYQRPLVKFEVFGDETMAQKEKRKQDELRQPLQIQSFYGRYDGFTLDELLRYGKGVKSETPEEAVYKMIKNPNYNPTFIAKNYPEFRPYLMKSAPPPRFADVLDKVLLISDGIFRSILLFEIHEKAERNCVPFGLVKNHLQDGKPAVFIHLANFSLWVTSSLAENSVALPLNLCPPQELEPMYKEQGIDVEAFMEYFIFHNHMRQELEEVPTILTNAYFEHLRYITQMCWSGKKQRKHPFDLSIFLPPDFDLEEQKSSLVGDEALEKMLGQRRPARRLLDPTLLL